MKELARIDDKAMIAIDKIQFVMFCAMAVVALVGAIACKAYWHFCTAALLALLSWVSYQDLKK